MDIDTLFIIFVLLRKLLMKESLNSDGQQYHQYQQNEQITSYLPLTFTHLTQKWKSMFWIVIVTIMWRM